MAGNDPITVDVRLGPNLSAIIRMVDAVDAALRVIPDWHRAEAEELLHAAIQLKSLTSNELRERGKPS